MRYLQYDYIEKRSENGVLVRVYTLPGKKEQGRFSLDVAANVLPYFKDYFGIADPLPKMDLIAVPDFAFGNNGLRISSAFTFLKILSINYFFLCFPLFQEPWRIGDS